MSETDQGLCGSNHRKPTATLPGQSICGGCKKALIENVGEVARLLTQVDDLGTLSARRGSGGRRGPSSQAPTDLDLIAIMDHRTQYDPGSDIAPVARWISTAAAQIARERNQAQVSSELRHKLALIHRNIDFLTTRPYAPTVAEHFAIMKRVLRSLCGENRHVIDRCTAPMEDGTDCGGPLFQAEDGSATVQCAKCLDKWSDGAVLVAYGELRRLGLILQSGERIEEEESNEHTARPV